MEFRGKIIQSYFDFFSKKTMVTVELDGDHRVDFSEVADDMRITFKKWRKRRSLDANAYFHVLVGKLADMTNISKTATKNMLLMRYGQYEREEDGHLMTILIRDDVNVSEREDIHLAPTSNCGMIGDKLYRTYIVMRGSHTYDTNEMRILIEGTISECKEVGLSDGEIMTPDEKEKLEKLYGIAIHSH